jgi:phosphohistidine phosphatase
MKKLYIIRPAKSKWGIEDSSDFERRVSKKGLKDINTIGSYLALRNIRIDLILSSCALRAQESADLLAKKLGYDGKILYLNELYLKSVEEIKEIISIQDDEISSMIVITHNPHLLELVNTMIEDIIPKFPTMGVVCLEFDIDSWSDIVDKKAKVEYFIYPNQFKYYIPKQIKATIEL